MRTKLGITLLYGFPDLMCIVFQYRNLRQLPYNFSLTKLNILTMPSLSMFSQKRNHNKHSEEQIIENMNCLRSLIEELKRENWHHSPDDVLLKVAHEKNIIQNNTATLKNLNKEDKKNLEEILALYYLKYEFW